MKKTDKGKKIAKTQRGREEKAKMKYEFHGVQCTSKIMYNWGKVTDTDLGYVSID